MNPRACCVPVLLLLALTVWFTSGNTQAEDAPNPKMIAAVNMLADMVIKKDPKAKVEAAAIDKSYGFDELMRLFALRDRGGIGIGAKTDSFRPDGIESAFINYEKRISSSILKKSADKLERAAYISAALALVTEASAPKKKRGKKDPKVWRQWSDVMYKSSLDLAVAFKAQDTTKVKAAAKSFNLSCEKCHEIFK